MDDGKKVQSRHKISSSMLLNYFHVSLCLTCISAPIASADKHATALDRIKVLSLCKGCADEREVPGGNSNLEKLCLGVLKRRDLRQEIQENKPPLQKTCGMCYVEERK